uniref:Putative terminase n=1 Tax=viral metagenome TaxID=1070528 RepID=A0A6M3KCY8_9ZZZZ
MTIRLTKDELIYPDKQERLIGYYQRHPVRCAKDVFDIQLIWFQRLALMDLWDKSAVFLLFGRGVGKTFLLALYASMYAILFPEAEIGYYTPTAKQWDVFWDYIGRFIINCPLFSDSVYVPKNGKPIKRDKGTVKMVFKNGSSIESISLNEQARGRRNHIAIFDEYKDHDINMINTIALHYLDVERLVHKFPKRYNKQIYATTGFYTWNHAYLKYVFYKYQELLGDKEYSLLEYDHRDVDLAPNSPYTMSSNIREQIRNEPSMTEDKFNMEMYCKICSESDAIFTYRLLDSTKVTPREDPVEILTEAVLEGQNEGERPEVALYRGCQYRKYVMGIDNARVVNGDNFALQIMELDDSNRICKLVHSLALNGCPLPIQAMKIFELVKKFNIVRIYIDNDSYGKSLKDLLAHGSEQNNLPPLLDIDDKIHQNITGRHIIRMYSFTVANIMEMFDKLKSAFEDGRLKFPVDLFRNEDKQLLTISLEIQRTKRELTQLQITQRYNGFVYTAPEGKKRDRAMSIGLCNMAAVDYYYADIITKPRHIMPVGVWVSGN